MPSRIIGPLTGPAKRAIFGQLMAEYQADLPAHEKVAELAHIVKVFTLAANVSKTISRPVLPNY